MSVKKETIFKQIKRDIFFLSSIFYYEIIELVKKNKAYNFQQIHKFYRILDVISLVFQGCMPVNLSICVTKIFKIM